MNFQMFKLDLEKAEEQEIELPTSDGSQRKQGNFRKTSISASLITLKPFTVWITTNWKILKRDGNTRPPYLPPEKSVCRSRSKNFQMFKLDLEKAEEPEIKLPTSTGSLKKQESSRKTSISALLTMMFTGLCSAY